MKKIVLLGTIVLAASFLGGCATSVRAPIVGGIFTDTTGPEIVTLSSASSKTGTSKCEAIFGVAYGDCSIEAAMKNGGIRKVHHVDSKVKNVLGIYVEYITIAKGE